ncbi:hypothetical protein PI124_g14542 [Phytophthora idaei]|nr:hypothetical protein PI124_g14542 [Phytophthora idaei]
MSTPLKALIQERLRAKMVCRRTDYELDDNYECDSDRLLRQPMDVTAYDITSRGDKDCSVRSTGSRGSTSRRSSTPQASYPVRLHTHIDPSAYLVPSHHDERYSPPSSSCGSGQGDHDRHRYSRHPREQYRDTNVYDQQHHQRDQRRRQNSHHRVRELPPRHEHPPRHINRQPSQTRASVSPWYRSEHGSSPSKTTRIPFRAASSPVHSPSLRAHRKQNYDYIDQDDYSRHRRDIKSSPRFATSSSSSHQMHHQDYYQRQHYTWKERDQDYGTQSAYEVREPSPTRNHDRHDYQTPDKPVRRSPMHHKQSIQVESLASGSCNVATVSPPRKPQAEKVNPSDVTKAPEQPERHSPPQLDMEIIEPSAKTKGRTRAWDGIMSPESRLAAKAFVEKRQRRSEKGTPRTMATQRWLEVIDARASRHKAGV